VARVEVGRRAVSDLEELIETHRLPSDTRDRVKKSLQRLETFPCSGAQLVGRWSGLRFITGPWRWMLIIYRYKEDDALVTIAAIQDGRASTAATSARD
jgi:plasmid stabilization system protein ParE